MRLSGQDERYFYFEQQEKAYYGIVRVTGLFDQ